MKSVSRSASSTALLCIVVFCIHGTLAISAAGNPGLAPAFRWAVKAAETGDSSFGAIAADALGNHFLAGSFSATGSFGALGAARLTSRGGSDIFVAKYDPAGALLWVQQAGGAGDDAATAIAVDNAGNCFITGSFTNSATFGSATLTSRGASDVFIAKYDANGNAVWARQAGGAGQDSAEAIILDGSGNCYLTGEFPGLASFGPWNVESVGSTAAFLAKYDANGNAVWARSYGGLETTSGRTLALDPAGNIFLGGYFYGNANIGTFALTPQGGWDLFVAKCDPNGNVIWAKGMGGPNTDSISSLGQDGQGNCYVAGGFSGSAAFGNSTVSSAGGSDTFLAKYDPKGELAWVRKSGNANDDYVADIAVDTAGNSYTVGTFGGAITVGQAALASAGGWDVLLTKYDTAGQVVWSKQAGGTNYDSGSGLAFTKDGGLVLVGRSYGVSSFDSVVLTTDSRAGALFLASVGPEGPLPAPPGISSQPQTQTVAAGTNVTFSVAASGTGPFSYQWKFNGANLAGETSASLTLTNVQTAQAGSYSVLVSNAGGSILSSAAILVVNAVAPPGIAPDFRWVAPAGGYGDDAANAIAVDSAGNQYVTGYFFQSVLFASSSFQSRGDADIYVAKYNPSGSLVWVSQIGGDGHETADRAIAVDAAGNVFVTGTFTNTLAFGSLTLTNAGGYDLFVAKYDTGGTLLWAKQAGGSLDDFGQGIAVDPSGNCYVTGNFRASCAFGNINLVSAGSSETFVAKYDTAGNPVWATSMGGANRDSGVSIAADSAGNSYLAGRFELTAAFGSTSLTSAGGIDVVLAKLNPAGSILWAKQVRGQSAADQYFGWSLALDGQDNIYMAGQFTSTASFGAVSLTSAGLIDAFLAKYDSNGNVLWARQFGGTGNDFGYSVAVDRSGYCYLGGGVSGQTTFGSATLRSAGKTDMFVAKYDPSGNPLWIRTAGGAESDYAVGIALGADGRLHIAGQFASTADFGDFKLASHGLGDLYVATLNAEGEAGSIPVIVDHPLGQRVTVGDPVTFQARAIGAGPIRYQWRFNATDIPGATNATLMIASARAGDSGQYDVVASDSTGSVPSVLAVLVVRPNVYSFTTLAGQLAPGSNDGIGKSARFDAPTALALDDAGNLYVADTYNSTIRKIAADGTVTTIAGIAGQTGSANGIGAKAQFNFPFGVAVAGTTIFVSDSLNHTIRQISADGIVSLLAGVAGEKGVANGGAEARLDTPAGLAIGLGGQLYIADSSASTIRVNYVPYSPGQPLQTDTFAGMPSVVGSRDGDADVALFYLPMAVAVDSAGIVYVADNGNNTIRRIAPDGFFEAVDTIAGKAETIGSTDGLGLSARFNAPCGIAADGEGNLYVADTQNNTIRKISRAGNVTTIGGIALQGGSADGIGSAARFDGPWGIAVDKQGALYIVDSNNNMIRKGVLIDPDAAAPTIVLQPQSQTVEAGANLTFTVNATGAGTLRYQWRLNGVELPGATAATLGLANVTSTQAGAYTVVVSNSGGSTTSAAAILAVNERGPRVATFVPSSGAPGTLVSITGTNLQTVTTVTLNGSGASFMLNSSLQMTVVVPAGASTGPLVLGTASGARVTAGTFTVTNSANLPPVVRFDSPISGQTFSTSSNILLQATATDTAGAIARLDFYLNGVLLYGLQTLPVPTIWGSYQWINAAPGSYTLTVMATDDQGAHGMSEPLEIRILETIALNARAAASGLDLTITWPASATGYVLETCASLGGVESWRTVTNVPVLSNNLLAMSQNLREPKRFYRLRAGPANPPNPVNDLVGVWWITLPSWSSGSIELFADGSYTRGAGGSGHYTVKGNEVYFDGGLTAWDGGRARLENGNLIFDWFNPDGTGNYFALVKQSN